MSRINSVGDVNKIVWPARQGRPNSIAYTVGLALRVEHASGNYQGHADENGENDSCENALTSVLHYYHPSEIAR